jgi:acetyltransferase-like isoleucine patch superfamily enzyme
MTAARLYLMRRSQFDNVALREYFRRKFRIDVGLYSYGCFDQWRMRGPMTVGRYCSIAATVRTVLSNHPMEALTTHPAIYERAFGVIDEDLIHDQLLIIEDDVWIGHHAIILPGCKRIGRGAIVGAGAIVTHDIEPYVVVAGNPARKLRDRFAPELAAAIEATRWWELSLDELGARVRQTPDAIYGPCVRSLESWSAAP